MICNFFPSGNQLVNSENTCDQAVIQDIISLSTFSTLILLLASEKIRSSVLPNTCVGNVMF